MATRNSSSYGDYTASMDIGDSLASRVNDRRVGGSGGITSVGYDYLQDVTIIGGNTNLIDTPLSTDIKFADEDNICISVGEDFTMTGKELKVCMKMLLEQAKKEMPEEFI
jgi:hypothetical protein